MIYSAQLMIPRSFINVISAACNSIEIMWKMFFFSQWHGRLGKENAQLLPFYRSPTYDIFDFLSRCLTTELFWATHVTDWHLSLALTKLKIHRQIPITEIIWLEADHPNCARHGDVTYLMWSHTFTVLCNSHSRLDLSDLEKKFTPFDSKCWWNWHHD